ATGGAGAGLAAGAGAALAQLGGAEGHFLLGAEHDVAQVDLHAAQHVAAAALARNRALAAAAHAGRAGEHVEDVAEVEAGAAASWEAAHAGPAAHVVLAALVGVGEGLVGLGDALDARGGIRVGVHVRVEGARELPVRLLGLRGRGVAGDAEQIVVVVVHGEGSLPGSRGEWVVRECTSSSLLTGWCVDLDGREWPGGIRDNGKRSGRSPGRWRCRGRSPCGRDPGAPEANR